MKRTHRRQKKYRAKKTARRAVAKAKRAGAKRKGGGDRISLKELFSRMGKAFVKAAHAVKNRLSAAGSCLVSACGAASARVWLFFGGIRERAARAAYVLRVYAQRCLRFIRDGEEQYYIGGSEVLPPPLSAEEEADILSRLTKERELTQVLIERNLRLVVYIAKKFENTGTDIEDIISIGTIGLIKAVNTFNPERGIKLATYASRCIENEILMHIRKNSGKRADVSIDEPLNVDWDGNELLLSDVLSGEEDEVYGAIEHDEDYRILHRAVEDLPEREQIIITLRFGLGGGPERTQAEVAKMLGISQSYISRLEKKILSDLRRTIGSGI